MTIVLLIKSFFLRFSSMLFYGQIRKNRLVYLLLFLLSISGFAQQNAWQSLSINDGLSQGMIYDMLEDRNGFMWFATKDGLNRYDGYNFKIFTNKNTDSFSISGNLCTALHEDKQGRLWVGTATNGLNLYDPRTQKFYHADVNEQLKKGSGNIYIEDILEDKQGRIWILAGEQDCQIFIVNDFEGYPKTKNFNELLCKPKLSQTQNTEFVGFYKPLSNAKTFKVLMEAIHPEYKDPIFKAPSLFLTFPLKTGNEFLSITENVDQLKYFIGDKFQKNINTPENQVPGDFFNLLNDGTICFSNNEYFWIFKPEDLNKIDRFSTENAFAKLPFSSRTNGILRDHNGNIWISTLGYGVYKFNQNTNLIQSFLPNRSINFLTHSPNNKIVVRTFYSPDFQFYTFDRTDQSFKVFYDGIRKHDHGICFAQDGSSYLVYALPKGNSLFLVCFDQTKRLKDQYVIYEQKQPVYINSLKILEDHQHNIWIGLQYGILLKYNPKTKVFTKYSYENLFKSSGALLETYALFEDSAGTIWLGTQLGLVKVSNSQTNPKFELFQNNATDSQSLANNFVSSIVEDPTNPRQYLFVSTKGGGFDRFEKNTGKCEHFNDTNGLTNNVVYGILVDKNKKMWLSTNRGISRFNPQTRTFQHLNKQDGLQDDEFNTNAFTLTTDGQVVFGGINGLNFLNPDRVLVSKTKPTLKIFGLKINNLEAKIAHDEVLNSAIEYSKAIELSHSQNQITLEFGVMNFTNADKNRYRYQLVGIDDDWVEAGTNHIANYAQIPSGSYTFRVIGTPDGENWSEAALLEITVNPPFYRSWWAYLLYITALLWVVYRFYQNQLNRVRLNEQLLYKNREAERLAELDSLKTRFFTNISHEFRTPLTLLVSPITDLIQKYPKETVLPVMQRNLFRLQNLINQLLDLSKLEANKMDLQMQEDNLREFLNIIFNSFKSMADSKGIDFEFEQNVPPSSTIFDADKIEKIITNLLSNAFKFTEKGGKISVNVCFEAGKVNIKVADTGIGIEQNRMSQIFDRFYQVETTNLRNYEGTGIGLALVKELVEVLKGAISVESELGKGTIFRLSIPTDLKTWEKDLISEKVSKKLNPIWQIQQGNPQKEVVLDAESPILLIVEDNTDLRIYIKSLFEETYQIIEAKDGQEGIEIAIEKVPDLVICDLMMPRLDGFGFCKALKTDIRTNHIPVVMLTAKATLDDRLEGLELGADDYLAKPFNTDELQIRVRNLIKIRDDLRQKFEAQTVPIALPKTQSLDEQFLQKINQIIEENIADSGLNLEILTTNMNLTYDQIRRKLKALTNQTVVEYIRNYRLQKAAIALHNKEATVSEVAFLLGFESLSYFSRIFKEKYGVRPSEW